MSAIDQNEDDVIECPLCMEPLEVDDISFFPCTCGYQICRFCWHRIRTDENGLCPACRKAYSEDPADFKPLSKEELVKIKAEKRHKNQQKKQKITENRKLLTDVRVVQRNLVFVLGLPARLAEAEVLKRHEYFGKFGKILKVVINQSSSYAGSQAPCSSAYLTYQKSDDALRAIQAVNNITVDGRVLKSSLGTTKYCSLYLKNQPCSKVDCMYLHDMGDPEASFTKDEMQQGKHQEFEKRLHDQLIQSMQQQQQHHQQQQQNIQISGLSGRSTTSPPSIHLTSHFPTPSEAFEVSSNSARSSPVDLGSNVSAHSSPTSIHRNKQHLDTGFGSDMSTNLTETIVYTNSHYVDNCDTGSSIYTCASQKTRQNASRQKKKFAANSSNSSSSNNNNNHINNNQRKHKQESEKATPSASSSAVTLNSKTETSHRSASDHTASDNASVNRENAHIVPPDIIASTANETAVYTTACETISPTHHYVTMSTTTTIPVFTTATDNSNSFFSSDSYPTHLGNCVPDLVSENEWSVTNEPHMPDVLPPVQSSEDWQAAFGFSSCSDELADESVFTNDDDLDFDPFTETQKALSEILEKEKNYPYYNNNINNSSNNTVYGIDYDVGNSYSKKLLSMQSNTSIDSCSKILSELYLGAGMQQKTTNAPPGFHNIPNQMNNYNIGISRSGNKLLPFAQQSLNTFQHNDATVGLDLTSLDPALVSAAAHRVNEFYSQQPPPGFSFAPVSDAKYMFNNYI